MDLVDLGIVPGYESYGVFAYGLNDSGQVVGTLQVENTPPEIARAFFWQNGTWELLPVLPGAPAGVTIAYAINDNGQIVGCADASPAPPPPATGHNFHAVRWQKVGGTWEITDLGCGNYSEAHDINDSGQVVGWRYPSGHNEAFLWLPQAACGYSTAGCKSLQGDIPDATQSEAHAINGAGDIAGWARGQTYVPPGWILWSGAWHWRCMASPHYGGLLLDWATAYDLNGDSEVVGRGYGEAFLCEGLGSCIFLPSLGGMESCANAISETHRIVGWSYTSDEDYKHACRWGPTTHAAEDLNNAIEPGLGWELIEATGINVSGQITCRGLHGGVTRACLLAERPRPAYGCYTNLDCTAGWYCDKGIGRCKDLTGECKLRRGPCIRIEGAACGCDGRTYMDACEAHSEGVNVAFFGECR